MAAPLNVPVLIIIFVLWDTQRLSCLAKQGSFFDPYSAALLQHSCYPGIYIANGKPARWFVIILCNLLKIKYIVF